MDVEADRTGLALFLQQSEIGRQVLSGQQSVTVLAPTDAALSGLMVGGDKAPNAATLWQYHLLKVRRTAAWLGGAITNPP